MPGVKITVSGIDKLTNVLKGTEADVRTYVEQATLAAATAANTTARSGCPYRTGRLRNGHQIRKGYSDRTSIRYELYNDVPYAPFVLWGHRTRSGSHVAGRDWITPRLFAAMNVFRAKGAARTLLTPV